MTLPARATLLRTARARFGISRFRPGQLPLIEAVLAGKDALGVLPTGAGKSLTYQLPALFLDKPVVVVSPLLALMQDQHEKLESADIPVASLSSALGAREEREVMADVREGAPEVVFVTPERLQKPETLDALRQSGVSLLVVDEAHCIAQWGHDFRPAFVALREALRALGRPPVLALTATATPHVADDIRAQLELDDPVVVQHSIERTNLHLSVQRAPREDDKRAWLASLLGSEEGCGIIYTATVRAAVELHRTLSEGRDDVGLYHGRLPTAERTETQERFMSGALRVLVATNAFGLGIDKPDIRFVVHHQLPDSLESYAQEAGRAGRDGAPARAILLYRVEDKRVRSYFLGGKHPREDDVQRVLDAIGSSDKGVGLDVLLEATELAEKRVRVILAELLQKELIAKKRGGLWKLIAEAGPARDVVVAEIEARRAGDRVRLEEMVSYAQTALCRMAVLQRYFEEADAVEACGHCDNCDAHASGLLAAGIEEPAANDVPVAAPAFEVDERVVHPSLGEGVVVATDDGVEVQFDKGDAKVVPADFLKRATPLVEAPLAALG
jgi:ATP-dependent DNA helicase RecQ